MADPMKLLYPSPKTDAIIKARESQLTKPLARALGKLVAEMLWAGKTDEQCVAAIESCFS